MKNELSEHSKKLRIKTSGEWKQKKINNGAYNFTVLITDNEIIKEARNIPNKSQFLIDAIKEFMNKKHA
jgi:hypothetical protein